MVQTTNQDDPLYLPEPIHNNLFNRGNCGLKWWLWDWGTFPYISHDSPESVKLELIHDVIPKLHIAQKIQLCCLFVPYKLLLWRTQVKLTWQDTSEANWEKKMFGLKAGNNKHIFYRGMVSVFLLWYNYMNYLFCYIELKLAIISHRSLSKTVANNSGCSQTPLAATVHISKRLFVLSAKSTLCFICNWNGIKRCGSLW